MQRVQQIKIKSIPPQAGPAGAGTLFWLPPGCRRRPSPASSTAGAWWPHKNCPGAILRSLSHKRFALRAMVEVGGIKVVDAGIPGGVQRASARGSSISPWWWWAAAYSRTPAGRCAPRLCPNHGIPYAVLRRVVAVPAVPPLCVQYTMGRAKRKVSSQRFSGSGKEGHMPWFFLQSAGNMIRQYTHSGKKAFRGTTWNS